MLFPKKNLILKATLMTLFHTSSVAALPFPTFDAHSAGMAGVGVASGAHNAVFYNPALLATNDERYEWVITAPGRGEVKSDPGDLEGGLDVFKRNATADSLAALKNDLYSESNSTFATMMIPSTLLSGAVYFLRYDYHTVKADNLAKDPPDYQSTLNHKGVGVVENGFTVAKLTAIPLFNIGDIQVGFTGKLMLIQGYGYRESIETGSLSIDEDQVARTSKFNIDIGLAKEYGIWKLGIVARNVLGGSALYGAGGESFDLGPQVKAGIARKHRHSLFEFDLDLTENDAVGHNKGTQFGAVGWEYELFTEYYLRFGYRQNLVGDQLATGTFGLGIRLWGAVLDMAILSNEDGQGLFGQLGMTF